MADDYETMVLVLWILIFIVMGVSLVASEKRGKTEEEKQSMTNAGYVCIGIGIAPVIFIITRHVKVSLMK
jgi:Na+-driven multidrug efflux pump